jgi:beta-xylosidase
MVLFCDPARVAGGRAYPDPIRRVPPHPSAPAALTALLAALALLAAPAPSAHGAVDPPHYENPVLQGEFPDPSAVRIGAEYWAATTAPPGQRFPPILRSPDLVHWTMAGALFDRPPGWTDGWTYWAPELVRHGDGYLAYYSARRRNGRLCVAVAHSQNAIGPYSDNGPLVCQDHGSIDPSVIHNNGGWPFLVWKEDGNSAGVPTSIWVQPLSQDGLRLTGIRRQILRAVYPGWERGIVEAPQIVRRRGWLYLFYSGNVCCGFKCDYAMGVARSRGLYGPWRRYRRNPILDSSDHWLCPGHGTLAQSPNGRWWMLYAGYSAAGYTAGGTAFDQRALLLDPIGWTRDGWPVVNAGTGPSAGH